MKAGSALARIKNGCGAKIVSVTEAGIYPCFEVRSEHLLEVLRFCKEDPECKMDYFECLTVLEAGQELALHYRLFSTLLGKHATLKTAIPRDGVVDSATALWIGASGYEREMAEMFGLGFRGHPNPAPMFLPTGWQGHPLRKDYVYPKNFAGIEHERPPLRKEHRRP